MKMRAVVQRVLSASATSVNGELINSINEGLCILLGIHREDTKKEVDYMVNKILSVKLFEDQDDVADSTKKWKKSVKDRRLEILCLSQVTLCHTFKGNKVDFHLAMSPSESKKMFEYFIEALRLKYDTQLVKEGRFGEHLIIDIKNNGPVTLTIDSPCPTKVSPEGEQTVPNVDK